MEEWRKRVSWHHTRSSGSATHSIFQIFDIVHVYFYVQMRIICTDFITVNLFIFLPSINRFSELYVSVWRESYECKRRKTSEWSEG